MTTPFHPIVRSSPLAAAAQALAVARSEEALAAALIAHARPLSGSDGIAVVRRDGNKVRYRAEDAIGPLWTGQSFPIEICISGAAMLQNRAILWLETRFPASFSLAKKIAIKLLLR